ncbi:pyridoxal-phosphate dependent enzyme family protein [Brucella lupini]|uniref:Pyridoxal-phosphate dependent enzyme family protein n=1 Tax=Brucella lupini TaxID=255457 RepID=A0A256GFT4_9HYPH|nr:pyridoxal-phosphate dependent enzyme family protein [Brucella lupini]
MIPPTVDDILEARRTLDGVAVRTPLLRSEKLDKVTGARIFIKCENLQRTGAFKFRGAYNCLSRLDRTAHPGGVVAYSTGNHGQAIATVGRMLGIAATIVMPSDAPAIKISKARENGAAVVLYDRQTQSREQIAAEIAEKSPVAIIPPGDNPFIIAGQGTVASEALEQAGNVEIDAIMVPCGGGGLSAGTCLAARASKSHAEIWAVEPKNFDDTRRSLLSRNREVNPALNGSICDALLAPTPAELPFSINRQGLSKVLVASDHEVLLAIRYAFEELRLVTEPGGVIALAALLNDPPSLRGKNVIVIVSGGNVEPAVFKQALDADHTSSLSR